MASRDLTTFLTYCRGKSKEQFADPLWEQLANEVTNYLGPEEPDPEDRTPTPDDVPLIGA